MNKLLHSGFYRFWKNKIYGSCLAGILLYCVFAQILQYMNKVKYGYEFTVDPLIFNFLPLTGVVFSVFVSLFVGTEYSDGTIRNKLVVGMPRTQIYISNLIIGITGGSIIIVSAYALCMALGIPLFGTPEMKIPQMALFMLLGICHGIAFISLYNMIAMINSSKTNGAVICILTAFALVFAAILIFSKLSQPEVFEHLVIKGGESILETMKNPNYLTGMKRVIYQNILDLLPSGQAMQMVNQSVTNPIRLLLYSVLVTIVTNVVGIRVFRRKDIK